MPIVTVAPREYKAGEFATQFKETIGTVSDKYTYRNYQDRLVVINDGLQTITLTVNAVNYPILAGQSVEVVVPFLSFDIVSASGIQQFSASTFRKVGVKQAIGQPLKWSLLAQDTFADLNNWEFLAADGTAGTAWTVAANKITSGGGALTVDQFALFKNINLNDGKVQVQIENPNTANAFWSGLFLRGLTKSNGLGVFVFNNGSVSLWRLLNNTFSSLVSVPLTGIDVALVTGSPISLEVEIVGATVKIYVNGRLMITSSHATIQDYGYGQCGLASHRSWAGSFSNFSIRQKSLNSVSPSIRKVLCVGTSVTFGQGQTFKYVDRLAARLTDEFAINPVTVVNGGTAGALSSDCLAGLPAMLTNNTPDVVVIESSINDSRIDRAVTLDQSITALRKMIKLVKQTGAIPLLTTATPIDPTIATASYDVTSWRKIVQMNVLIRQLAAQENVILVDNFNAFSNNLTLISTTDKIHPNDLGAQVLADTVFSAIIG